MQKKSTFLLLAACLGVTTVFAQPGALDKSFAGNGLLRTLLGTNCVANDVKVQTDGKIVVAGQYTTAQNLRNFLIERYNSDGSFDNSFAGGDGEQGINFGDYSEADAVALQTNGKIVASGYTYSKNVSPHLVVVQLKTNGSLDNGFGVGGKVNFTNVFNAGYNSVAIQGGKILVTIPGPGQSNAAIILVRLNSNGIIDNSFGTNGFMTVSLSKAGPLEDLHMVVQPDEKIVLCCTHVTIYVDHSIYEAVILRLNKDGSIDTDFGTNGIVYQQVGSRNATGATCITLQSDNKIVVGGYYAGVSGSEFLVMRFNTNGSLDNTFAGNGRAGIAFSHPSRVTGIAVQGLGGIIAGGWTNSGTDVDFAMVRLQTDGSLDPTFGSAGTGKVTTGFGYTDFENALTLQPNGKIVTVGYSGNDIALARYLVSVAIPPPPLPAIQTTQLKIASLQPALYPNPAGGSIQLTGLDPQSNTRYIITNAAGKTQATGNIAFSGTAQINTTQLPPGVYFIQLKTNNKITTLRMVKE